jgi:hypothetical protein
VRVVIGNSGDYVLKAFLLLRFMCKIVEVFIIYILVSGIDELVWCRMLYRKPERRQDGRGQRHMLEKQVDLLERRRTWNQTLRRKRGRHRPRNSKRTLYETLKVTGEQGL